MSISNSISRSSSTRANCPSERITLPSSSFVIDPSPSLSNNRNASRNSNENLKGNKVKSSLEILKNGCSPSNYPSFDFSILIVDYCPWLWCVRRTMWKRTFLRCLRLHSGMVSVIQLKHLGCNRLRHHRHNCPHTVLRCSHPISHPIARYYFRNRYLRHPVRCYFESI